MRRGGRLIMTATALGAVSVLSACTVPLGAVTGISVSADGKPAAVIAVCQGHINAAVLYRSDSARATVGWDHDGDITGLAVWPFSGDSGWKPDKPVPALAPGMRYTLYGATKDNTWSGAHIDFTAADLATLKPGQVRYAIGYDEQSQTERFAVVPLSQFRSKACAGMK